MTKRLMLYAAWCLSMLAGAAISSYFAWSPWSDEDKPQANGPSGPNHK